MLGACLVLAWCLSFNFICAQFMLLSILFIWVLVLDVIIRELKQSCGDPKVLTAQTREKYFKAFQNLVHQICNYFCKPLLWLILLFVLDSRLHIYLYWIYWILQCLYWILDWMSWILDCYVYWISDCYVIGIWFYICLFVSGLVGLILCVLYA